MCINDRLRLLFVPEPNVDRYREITFWHRFDRRALRKGRNGFVVCARAVVGFPPPTTKVGLTRVGLRVYGRR